MPPSLCIFSCVTLCLAVTLFPYVINFSICQSGWCLSFFQFLCVFYLCLSCPSLFYVVFLSLSIYIHTTCGLFVVPVSFLSIIPLELSCLCFLCYPSFLFPTLLCCIFLCSLMILFSLIPLCCLLFLLFMFLFCCFFSLFFPFAPLLSLSLFPSRVSLFCVFRFLCVCLVLLLVLRSLFAFLSLSLSSFCSVCISSLCSLPIILYSLPFSLSISLVFPFSRSLSL